MSALRPLALSLALLPLAACDGVTDRPPSRAQIVGVWVEDAPLRQGDGSRWDGDAGGGPEVYVRLYDDGALPDASQSCRGGADLMNPRDDAFVVPRFSEQPWYDDVQSPDFPLVWDVDGFEVRPLDRPLTVVLCDYDPTTTDDEIGVTRSFTLAERAPDRADGREDSLVLEGEGADRDRVLVRLRVVYR